MSYKVSKSIEVSSKYSAGKYTWQLATLVAQL